MLVSLIGGTTVSFVYGWPVASLIILFIPLIVVVLIIKNKLATGKGGVQIEAYERATKLAVESLENIRTVQVCHGYIPMQRTVVKECSFRSSQLKMISTPNTLPS